MSSLVRRRFIQGAGAALAAAAPSATLAQGAPRASKLSDIDHFIILMKENRSFDHYFGSLSGVRGFDDPTANRPDGTSVFRQSDDLAAAGHVSPFRLSTLATSAQRIHELSHAWGPQHAAWNGGRMDSWIAAHRLADGARGPMTMGYLTREDIPFYYALADAFTVCDGYHCSVFGPTNPNRYYLMTGQIDAAGRHGGPAVDNEGRAYSWETYPERLERAGVTWRVYHDLDDYDCNVLKYFVQYQNSAENSPLRQNALVDRPFYELLWDISSGAIPQVTWIVPPSDLSEHPDYLPAAGENHTAQVLTALWSNPKLWARTALILNYDENDGLFDHVAPPTPPSGAPEEYVGGLPIGMGYRVPCLIVSPFSRGGYVCSQAFDHTSVLRLLEARFGVEAAGVSAWRRATSGDLTSAFGFGEPPRFDLPRLPETANALLEAELKVMTLPAPEVPTDPPRPRQEPGSRPRRG